MVLETNRSRLLNVWGGAEEELRLAGKNSMVGEYGGEAGKTN